MPSFTALSSQLTKQLTADEKKTHGIFFTPQTIIDRNLSALKELGLPTSGLTLLEPSCGSCEYILKIANLYTNSTITGIEMNTTIFNNIQHISRGPIVAPSVTPSSVTPSSVTSSVTSPSVTPSSVTPSSVTSPSVTPSSVTPSSVTSSVTSPSVTPSSVTPPSVAGGQDPLLIRLVNADFLNWDTTAKYDLIIGNPPYYVMWKKQVPKKYWSYFTGRPNIFILFIIRSLELLAKNGVMSFVLPSSFMNCQYYDNLRRHIYKSYTIIGILECSKDKYIDTHQETVIFMVQNVPPVDGVNDGYSLLINGSTTFNTKDNIIALRRLYANYTTLDKLGVEVTVGSVVWNQCKDILTDSPEDTLLIYSSNISDRSIVLKKYNNAEKKQYIKKKGITTPMIVINRGYGSGKYNLEYCLVDSQKEFLVENHLICLSHPGLRDDGDTAALLELYRKIMTSLSDERTKEFIRIYFKNNAINTRELKCILPIYLA
jgi:glutaredoxin